MARGWDEDAVTEQPAQREETWEQRWARITREREARRVALGYMDIPYLDDATVTSNFPFWAEHSAGASSPIGKWGPNRKMYICHNCGAFGYKQDTSFPATYKCPSCRSRAVTMIRGGEISRVLRARPEFGRSMEDIYREHQENRRRARRARRERSTI